MRDLDGGGVLGIDILAQASNAGQEWQGSRHLRPGPGLFNTDALTLSARSKREMRGFRPRPLPSTSTCRTLAVFLDHFPNICTRCVALICQCAFHDIFDLLSLAVALLSYTELASFFPGFSGTRVVFLEHPPSLQARNSGVFQHSCPRLRALDAHMLAPRSKREMAGVLDTHACPRPLDARCPHRHPRSKREPAVGAWRQLHDIDTYSSIGSTFHRLTPMSKADTVPHFRCTAESW
jgi:hypothetical protein